MGLIDDALAGNRRAIARLATRVESGDHAAEAILERIYSRTGGAFSIGVTGPPGAGKSTLINGLIGEFRQRAFRVAVIAVDPTSPLTGGAALGDRIRMLERYADPDVFIRSMASRGAFGGLALATASLIHLFDACGYDRIIVESVGVGQEEVGVWKFVDSTMLVQVPGLGDGVQALKAGVFEIADLYLVNKSDLPGADAVAREIRASILLSERSKNNGGWQPPILMCSSSTGQGMIGVLDALEEHSSHLLDTGDIQNRRRRTALNEVEASLEVKVRRQLHDASADMHEVDELISAVMAGALTPSGAASTLLQKWGDDQG